MARCDWVRVVLLGSSLAVLPLSCGGTIDDVAPSDDSSRQGVAGMGAGGADDHVVVPDEAVAEAGASTTPREGSAAGAGGVPEMAGVGGHAGEPADAKRGQKNGRPLLGESCASDADCGGDGLRCLGADDDYAEGSGAPPNGICTADCTLDAACRVFDESAVCATLDEVPLMGGLAEEPAPRFCMLGCQLGAPSGSTKCHGRQDLACRPFAPPDSQSCEDDSPCAAGSFCYRGQCRATACGPRCNDDDDCAHGRYCDPLWGLCTTEVPEYTPIGVECLAEGDSGSACGWGMCLAVFARVETEAGPRQVRVKDMCTQPCTLGTLCAEGAGACVSPRLPNYAPGDVGYCLQKCDCDGDCRNSADRCRALSPDNAERYGSQGVCDYAPEGSPSLPCAVVGAGGAGAGGAAGGSGG
jgi:hypothetical protein